MWNQLTKGQDQRINFGAHVFDMIVKIPPKKHKQTNKKNQKHSLKKENENTRGLEALKGKWPWVQKMGRK